MSLFSLIYNLFMVVISHYENKLKKKNRILLKVEKPSNLFYRN